MLETLGLEYHYQQGKKIVFPEIGLKRGQRLLISGFSGCGKTTLLSLIAGALNFKRVILSLMALITLQCPPCF